MTVKNASTFRALTVFWMMLNCSCNGLKKSYPGLPIFVMGHSMGALIAAHLELGRFAQDADIKGVILSSPYFVNAVKVPTVLLWFSDALAKLFPRMKVPLESVTDQLTHDARITARHHADEQDNIRAREVTFRFAAALLSAQAGLRGSLAAWTHPVFAVLAGDDKLADAQAATALLKTIAKHLLSFHLYPENFHENFNECNRDAIFAEILKWMEARTGLWPHAAGTGCQAAHDSTSARQTDLHLFQSDLGRHRLTIGTLQGQ